MIVNQIQKITDIKLKQPVYDYRTGVEIGFVNSLYVHQHIISIELYDCGYCWLYYRCGISVVAANESNGVIWSFSDISNIPRIKFKKG
jgi:hypothetical protein